MPHTSRAAICFYFIVITVTTTLFFIRAISLLDPDFGWHVRMGNQIIEKGIPATDPFSYTMPSFPFVDHEWLTNIAIYSLYSNFGYISLSIVFLGIWIATVYVTTLNTAGRKLSKNFSFSKRLLFNIILMSGFVFIYFGVRPQVISWFFLSLLLYGLLNAPVWNRFRYMAPLLFLVWANAHASFAAGLVTYVFFFVLQCIRKKKTVAVELLIILLSVMATLINPYGARVWGEVWMQLSDTRLRWTIGEWQPTFYIFNPFFMVLFPLSLFILWKQRKTLKLEERGLYLAYLVQGSITARHAPLWMLITVPLVWVALNDYYKIITKIPFAPGRFSTLAKALTGGLFITFIIFTAHRWLIGGFSKENTFYPVNAVQYLANNQPHGNIFSDYGWGGYLIWKLPEKKVFIDGRMPSWRWEITRESESNDAMRDYDAILADGQSYKTQFVKYQITTVLLPLQRNEQGLFTKLDGYIYKFIGANGATDNQFSLHDQLIRDKWSVVHKDNVSIIYQKASEAD